MKVFVAWSGRTSRDIGSHLREFLPSVLGPNVSVFMSEHDIQGGEPWFSRIAGELATSDYAIICLTPDNVSTPWVHWEAGAIASRMEQNRACPYCWGFDAIPRQTPLAELQARQADKAGTLKLIAELNGMLRTKNERAYDDATVTARFNGEWPALNDVFLACAAPTANQAPSEILDAIQDRLTELTNRLLETRVEVAALRNAKYNVEDWALSNGEAYDLLLALHSKNGQGDSCVRFHGPGGRFVEVSIGERP